MDWPPVIHGDIREAIEAIRLEGGVIRDRNVGAFDLNYALPGWRMASGSTSLFSGTGAAPVISEVYYTPIVVTEESVFDHVGVSVTTLASGGLIRLGLYASNPATRVPTTRLYDFGTVSTTTTGDKFIAVSLTLEPGLYWLAACADNTTVRCQSAAATGAVPPTTSIYQAPNSGSGGSLVIPVQTGAGTPAASGLPSPAGSITWPNTGVTRAWAHLRYDRTV
jgi:hypothetical protein